MADANWTGSCTGNDRLLGFLGGLNERALLQRASTVKGGQVECKLSEKFSIGTVNYVRKIAFADGTNWVARIRLPPFEDMRKNDASFWIDARKELRTEAAAMEFVRENTSIPVPQVFDVNEDQDGAVGFPFILMEYIDANTAEEVAERQGAPWGTLPERFERPFWKQLASITVQLASIRAPMIGLLAPGSSKSHVVVGPFAESKSGPYKSCAEFYDDFPVQLGRQVSNSPIDGQDELIDTFRTFAKKNFSKKQVTQPETDFGLVHYDLGAHNVLVDDEFTVKAVIDWDALFALPRAGSCFLPRAMGMDATVPGVFPKIPHREAHMSRALEYSRVVEEVSKEQAAIARRSTCKGRQPLILRSTEFFEPEAIAYRLLERVNFQQDFANREAADGLKWMESHSRQELDLYLDIKTT